MAHVIVGAEPDIVLAPLDVLAVQGQAEQDQGQGLLVGGGLELQQEVVVEEEDAPPHFGVAFGYDLDHGEDGDDGDDDDAGHTICFILLLGVIVILGFVNWSGIAASYSSGRYGVPEIRTAPVPPPCPCPTRETGAFLVPPPPRSTIIPETGTALAPLPSPTRGHASPMAAPTPPPKCDDGYGTDDDGDAADQGALRCFKSAVSDAFRRCFGRTSRYDDEDDPPSSRI